MRRTLTTVVLLVALAPLVSPAHGQTPPRARGQDVEAMQQRRAQLEQQVRHQFLAQAAERLALDAGQREQLEAVLRRGAEARRALAQESRQLRIELLRNVADERTTIAAHQSLLDRMRNLQSREQELERRETAALAEFLDARQQAQFLVLRMRMNERVRGMRGQRPGPPTDRPGDAPMDEAADRPGRRWRLPGG
jgi:hypothetical protein